MGGRSLVSVRQLTRIEALDPSSLPLSLQPHGFPYLDPEWAWIVEHSEVPIALIVTSFAHGMLVIWRVLSTAKAKSVSGAWFLASLPIILDNAKQRGCVGYLSMFEDSHPSEPKLARIMSRSGGVIRPFVGTLGVGAIGG